MVSFTHTKASEKLISDFALKIIKANGMEMIFQRKHPGDLKRIEGI